jgi:hypothetical protein
MFGGGSTAAAAEDAQSTAATNYDGGAAYAGQGYQAQGACMTQISTFRECMDKNQVHWGLRSDGYHMLISNLVRPEHLRVLP